MAPRERDVLTEVGGSRPEGRALRLVVEGDTDRVDRYLARVLAASSRRHAQALCARGLVTRAGRRLAKGDLVAAGDLVEVTFGPSETPSPNASLELRILIERPDVVVVDKPPGVPSAAVGTRVDGTLAGALVVRYPEMAGVGFHVREPGLLHRLDTFTSGAIAAARTPEAFAQLRAAMAEGRLEKTYVALAPPLASLVGVFESGLRGDRSSRRVVVDPSAPQRRTAYRTLARGPNLSLYEVSVGLAYRHQIRAHFAEAGAPLLGDALYGGRPWLSTDRHALHARSVSLIAPSTQTTGTGRSSFIWRAEAALPDDFVEALRSEGLEPEALIRTRML